MHVFILVHLSIRSLNVLFKKPTNLHALQCLFKTFVSWFQYAAEKRRKKAAINKALERRHQWLHKVAVTQWIEVSCLVKTTIKNCKSL